MSKQQIFLGGQKAQFIFKTDPHILCMTELGGLIVELEWMVGYKYTGGQIDNICSAVTRTYAMKCHSLFTAPTRITFGKYSSQFTLFRLTLKQLFKLWGMPKSASKADQLRHKAYAYIRHKAYIRQMQFWWYPATFMLVSRDLLLTIRIKN